MIQNYLLLITHIDEVPVTNSTKKQFWPILGRGSQVSSNPFAIWNLLWAEKTDSSSIFLKM